MRAAGAALVLSAGLAAVPAASARDGTPAPRDAQARSVVGLEVTYQMWDEDRPWSKKTPKHRSATAVLVEGGRLLTTAHMIDHATLIRMEAFGESRAVEPRVVRVDPDVNLALLAVDSPAALEGLRPVRLAAETPTAGTLRTVRWRRRQLESVGSRVTRFEVQRSYGGPVEHAFLHMRTDLTGGGWAEPVFQDGRLVGITVSQADQNSRAIPVEIVRAFLERATASGPYVGFPALGVTWQTNRDPAVSRFLGQADEPRGMLVRQVPWGSSGCGVLKPRDIVLELDGLPIDAEGYYQHPRLGRLRLGHHLVEHHRPGDSIPVRVLRAARVLDLRMTLRTYPAALRLVPLRHQGPPPYVIAGGLVLRELNVPYLRTWGKDWTENSPIGLLSRYHVQRAAQTAERRRIVVLTTVVPSAHNVGYQDLRDEVVERINGRLIGSLADVTDALGAPEGGFHVFDLAPDSTRGQIVLDAGEMAAATAEILAEYRIPEATRSRRDPLPPAEGICPDDY